jgi:hypothetical protein
MMSLRVPDLAPPDARGTSDANAVASTRERAEAFVREHMTERSSLAAAVAERAESSLVLREEQRAVRLIVARARTVQRRGVTRLVKSSALSAVVTFGACVAFGPLGGVAVVLGGLGWLHLGGDEA